MTSGQHSVWRWLLPSIVILAGMWAAMAVLREGPALDSLDFDTAAAMEIARALNPDSRPHPSGSEENRRVATRIQALLEGYGYRVDHQAELFCTDFAPGCTQLDNLVAVKAGAGPASDAILLTAHYDSVPGSPGAADDMAGVAALLETARVLASEPPLRNDVILLVADAEETGLRGAQAFVRDHPLMKRVKLAVNLEARGISGPSLMFETSVGNAALLDLFAASASRPVASSLMYEAYRRMPNNTDLTIYKKAGALGINFAFSRGVALYHSSRDDLQHLNPASLGHHGDNLLHFVRQAGNADLAALVSDQDASYLDLCGRYLLVWPAAVNLPAALLALVTILGVAFSLGTLRVGRVFGSWGVALLLIATQLLTGWLLSYPLARWPGIHGLDHPYPGAGNLALFAASLLLTLLWGAFAGRRIDRTGFLFANWTLYSLFACLLAWAVPGAAYMALLPALVFALGTLAERLLRPQAFPLVSAWTGFVVAAYIAVYHFIFMDVLTSFYAAWLKMAPLCLAALAAAPLAAHYSGPRGSGRRPALALAAVLAVAATAAALVPAYTADRPRSVNVAYQQIQHTGDTAAGEAAPSSTWRLFTYGPPDRDYAQAAGFPDDQETFYRWGLREAQAYLRDSPGLGLPVPLFTVTGDRIEGEDRVLEGTVQAGRAGFLLGVSFAPDTQLTGLEVDGTPVLTGDNYDAAKGAAVTFSGVGDQPLVLQLRVPAGRPFDLVVFELSAFPDDYEGAEIVRLRPDDAAAIHFADHSEVQHHYHF